ncbi:MAG: redoxin family protein [Leptotrichiaceae bacterium]|nr:redoxin family protein [Leptotrichiaceae bacterium]
MKKLVTLLLVILSFNILAVGGTSLNGIQLKDLNNNTVSLSKYKGKKVYIKMWASWCPVCLAGLQELDTLSGEKNKNFEVITIVSPGYKGEKPKDKFVQWYKGLNYKNVTVLMDEKGEVLKKAQVRGYPSNVILDANLNVVKVLPGHMNSGQIKGAVK